MARGQWSVVLRHVQKIFQGASVAGLTEGQLLDRFLATRDEAAFGAIVARHGPMVLGVCRGVLTDPHDVEDAFQATFLILVKKARGLQNRDRLGPWLYGVARRVALRAKTETSNRRSRHTTDLVESAEVAPPFNAELREVQFLVREEVDRLTSHDRMAVVLCYLEGLTHEEAAERLGWPIGTVKGRLSRAREKLKDRLSRRGVTLPAVFLANSAPSLSLIRSTTLAAAQLAAGPTLTAGIISAPVLTLMNGVLGTMYATPLKIAATIITASGLLAVPAVLAYPGLVVQDKKEQVAKPTAVSVEQPGSTPKIAGPPISEQAKSKVISAESTAPIVATPAEASGVSADFAEQAVKLMDRLRAAGEPVSEESYALWSRRLVDSKLAQGVTPADRVKLLRIHLKRMEEIFERAKQLKKSGQISELNSLEIAFQLNETYRQVLEAEAPPKPQPKPTAMHFTAIEGGGFGGGDEQAERTPLVLKSSPEDEKKNEAILAKLELPLAMKFATETPLEDVKKYIQDATQDEAGGFPIGIPIYVDPFGLQVADKTMSSTISIDLEGIPLRTTLRLMLHQLQLDYRVVGSLLVISDEEGIKLSETLEKRQPKGQEGVIPKTAK